MIKKFFFIFFIIFLAALIYKVSLPKRQSGSSYRLKKSEVIYKPPINLENKEYTHKIDLDLPKNLLLENIKDAKKLEINKVIKAGIVSHHIPAALPLIAGFYSNLAANRQDLKKFIVIGPQHRENCSGKIVMADWPYVSNFSKLPVSGEATSRLKEAGVKVDNQCFSGEHAISVQANLIGYFFPDAILTAIIVSSAADDGEINRLADTLSSLNGIFIIGSMDFSHYQNYEKANRLDKASAEFIINRETNAFDLEHVDSPPTMKLIAKIALIKNWQPFIADIKNSFDYNRRPDNTTGYIAAYYFE